MSRPQVEQLPIPSSPGLQNGLSTFLGLFNFFTQAFSAMWTIIPRFLQLFRLFTGAGSGAGGDGIESLGADDITSLVPSFPGQ